MADLARIKSNVAKMASQNAPEEDIDGYIASEGVSVDDIKNFGRDRSAFETPEYQGGALSPALIKAKQDVSKAEMATGNLDNSVAPIKAAYNMSWPVSMLAKSAMGQGNTPVPEPTTGEGKLLGDMGAVANPLTGEAINLGLKGFGLVGRGIMNTAKTLSNKPIKSVQEALKPFESKYTQPLGLPRKEVINEINHNISQAKQELVKSNDDFMTKISSKADSKAEELQKDLGEHFGNNADIYGNKLTKISDDLVNKNEQITRGELDKIISDTIKESSDEILPDSPAMDVLKAMKNKYGISESTVTSPILDASGKPISETIKTNLGDKLNLKEVVEDIKGVKNALSTSLRSGSRFEPKDVVMSKFLGKWGDFLETRVPELKSLNEEYRPIVENMRITGRYFKPNSTGQDKIQGVSLLKNYAENKLQFTQKKLLKIMQEGTENFPGMGDKIGELRNLGAQNKAAQREISNTIKQFEREQTAVRRLQAQETELVNNRNKAIKMLIGTGLIGAETARKGKDITGLLFHQ